MKRVRLSTIIISIVIVGGALAAAYWPRPAGGELYRHYEGRSDIKASYFKDYRINDSVTVDVTMLQALSDTGWTVLQKDFGVPQLDSIAEQYINCVPDFIMSKYADKDDYSKPLNAYSPNCETIMISYTKHTICIFHIKNHEEGRAILYYNLDKTTKQQNIDLY